MKVAYILSPFVQDQANSPLKSFLGFFVIIMYINGQWPHKQAKYTPTKYITQYGANGQSENCVNINVGSKCWQQFW